MDYQISITSPLLVSLVSTFTKTGSMIQPLLLWALGGTELIIILAVIILIFGGRKIPELIRGVGRGIREFKEAKNAKKESSDTDTNSQT